LFKIINKIATGITLVVVLAGLILASCSSATTQTTTPASGQQSANQPAQKSSSSSQQPSGQQSSGQQPAGSPGQPPGNDNMTAIVKRAAEILGISTDKFTTVFQNAMPKRTGSDQQGGQPPTPPSGQQVQPPSGGQQGQPPAPSADQSMTQSQVMTDVYTKMATELGISADSISKAMVQAEKELKK
jgi:hypothetical protein